jgi:hypothetical protein
VTLRVTQRGLQREWYEERGARGFKITVVEGRRAFYEDKYYPLYPYGNYVSSCVMFEKRGGWIRVEVKTVRDSWGGTGAEVHDSFSVRASEAEKYLDPVWVDEQVRARGAASLVKEVMEKYWIDEEEEWGDEDE